MDAVEFLAKRLRELDNARMGQVGWQQNLLARRWEEIEPSVRNVWIEDVRTALRDLREDTGFSVFVVEKDGSITQAM